MDDASAINSWLSSGKSVSTQKIYRRVVADLFSWGNLNGIEFLSDFTPVCVQSFVAWRCDGRVGAAAKNQIVAVLRSLFAYCCEIGYLTLNPAQVLESSVVDDLSKSGVLRLPDVLLAIQMEPVSAHSDLLALAFGTGASVMELISVKGADVVSMSPLCFVVGENRRTVACSASMSSKLSFDPKKLSPEDYLVGNKISYVTGWRWMRDALSRINAVRGDGQWLRASSAVHMREGGATWDYIAWQLGYSPLYAMNTYGPLCESPRKDFTFALSL